MAGISESHNEEYYAVEDQRFLGEEGFGKEISREAGEKDGRKTKKPIETTVKEIAKRLGTTGEELRGKDRRWVVARKRAEAVALWFDTMVIESPKLPDTWDGSRPT